VTKPKIFMTDSWQKRSNPRLSGKMTEQEVCRYIEGWSSRTGDGSSFICYARIEFTFLSGRFQEAVVMSLTLTGTSV
jgi:hypothetical protein